MMTKIEALTAALTILLFGETCCDGDTHSGLVDVTDVGPDTASDTGPRACPTGHESWVSQTGMAYCLGAGTPADVAGMVIVPAGEFPLGSPPDETSASGLPDKPQTMVYLSAFYIDKREVTVDAYKMCMQAGMCTEPGLQYRNDIWTPCTYAGVQAYEAEPLGSHPVNCVSAFQARDFCVWQGKDLPTEAQWERTATGTTHRLFVWGDECPTSWSTRVAWMSFCAGEEWDTSGDWWSWPVNACHDSIEEAEGQSVTYEGCSATLDSTPEGACDMGGNLKEWTLGVAWDKSGASALGSYDQITGLADPPGDWRADYCVHRGGHYSHCSSWLRVSERSHEHSDMKSNYIGFRCAVPAAWVQGAR